MNMLAMTCARIAEPNRALLAQTQAMLDEKTKPRGSLGRLEDLARDVANMRGVVCPSAPNKAIVVMAADHGVVDEGVSAYPQDVTAKMLLNFACGGAAINVLARNAGARLVVVDMGVREPLGMPTIDTPELRSSRIGPGTRNLAREPAMTRAQALRAIEVGIALADELVASGVTLIGVGDMGIGNATSSSALACLFTDLAPQEIIGRGNGAADDASVRRTMYVVQRALELHHVNPLDGVGGLAALGGFEIAGLAGVILGAAAARVPVVIDGFICSTAALAAVRIEPRAAHYLIASHRSVEAGHRLVLRALGTRPLLDLEMRLGEGTGAALAMGLVDAAIAILNDMATFDSGRVKAPSGVTTETSELPALD